ncbi:MAG: DUF5666 domain-containing protein [Patescibacteria group bacterium]|nr:DUF5666 domain-containing protein [Patescibacteria group bacterium]
MKITQNLKVPVNCKKFDGINKSQNYCLKLKTKSNLVKTFTLYAIVFSFAFYALSSKARAQSVTPQASLTPKPTSTITTTPSVTKTASPSAIPTNVEDEKVKEIRDAIKEKVNEIKEKIEKKAFVGTISQITDSTLTINNFRGKERVRLTEETTIIGANKKEIKSKELAVDDKIIAMGSLSDNEILEAKRVVVIPAPTKPIPKRKLVMGILSEVDSKNSSFTLTPLKDQDKSIQLKVDKATLFSSLKDAKAKLAVKDLKDGQKVFVFYPETTDNKTPIVKSIFVLQ